MLTDDINKAFDFDDNYLPPMTLRSGNEVDNYSDILPFDALLDEPTDEYLESYYDGINYLDTGSWKHYLPILINFTLRNYTTNTSMVIDSFVSSLRPPDREPPRLKTLNKQQEDIIVKVLDILAFDEKSICKEEAILALEEYWAPGALYRGNDT